jgi:hypothetical protein
MEQLPGFRERGRNAKGSIDYFDEISLFAQDKLPALRERKVLAPLRVRFQA